MKPIQTFKKKTGRVDTQVSLLACVIVCISCVIMFTITFSVMRSVLKNAYGARTDITYGIISSHLDDGLYNGELSENDYSSVLSYLTAMSENMSVADITVYRRDKNGDMVCAIDTKLAGGGRNVNGAEIEASVAEVLKKLVDNAYFGQGDFFSIKGKPRYMKFYPVYDERNSVKGAVGIALDAGELHTAVLFLRVLAVIIILLGCFISVIMARVLFRRISNPLYQDVSNTDALTGFKNKNSFSVDLHNIEVSNKKRYSVISADLNGLKTINDTMGHQMGDIYLKRAAEVIRGVMEEEDAACYRVGGDEFIVILKDKSIKDLERLTERIDEAAENDNRTNNGVKLSISLGFAQFDASQDKNFSMTIERSDKIMYENKRMYYQKKNLQPR